MSRSLLSGLKFLRFSTLRPRKVDAGWVLGDLTFGWGLVFLNGVFNPLRMLRVAIAAFRVKETVPSMHDPNWVHYAKLCVPEGHWEEWLRHLVHTSDGRPMDRPPIP